MDVQRSSGKRTWAVQKGGPRVWMDADSDCDWGFRERALSHKNGGGGESEVRLGDCRGISQHMENSSWIREKTRFAESSNFQRMSKSCLKEGDRVTQN